MCLKISSNCAPFRFIPLRNTRVWLYLLCLQCTLWKSDATCSEQSRQKKEQAVLSAKSSQKQANCNLHPYSLLSCQNIIGRDLLFSAQLFCHAHTKCNGYACIVFSSFFRALHRENNSIDRMTHCKNYTTKCTFRLFISVNSCREIFSFQKKALSNCAIENEKFWQPGTFFKPLSNFCVTLLNFQAVAHTEKNPPRGFLSLKEVLLVRV